VREATLHHQHLFTKRRYNLTRLRPERYAQSAQVSQAQMNSSDAKIRQPGTPAPTLPKLPVIWVGYLLGVATLAAEFVALSLHPELAKEGGIPPLYLFLVSFVGGVYWFVCVHRYHVILAKVPGWKHPIAPARAVGFHFIPFFNLYWVFKWPKEIARFVNIRLGSPVMKPVPVGIAVLGALVLRILDPGFGLILLFFPMSYMSNCLGRALAASPTTE
jgi:hypothetical protein